MLETEEDVRNFIMESVLFQPVEEVKKLQYVRGVKHYGVGGAYDIVLVSDENKKQWNVTIVGADMGHVHMREVS